MHWLFIFARLDNFIGILNSHGHAHHNIAAHVLNGILAVFVVS